jgi:hypothetical protein
MPFEIRNNLPQFTAGLHLTQSRISLATAMALTWTAQDVRSAEQQEMRSVFDRPTNYSLNAFQMTPATRENLVATVEQKSASGSSHPRTWFNPQVHGGARRSKAFESALAARLGLPIGTMQVQLGAGAKLDAFGNLSRGQLGQILSDLGARQTDPHQNATDQSRRRNRRARHFVMKDKSGRPKFVAVRMGAGFQIVLVLDTKVASYRPRFDFYGVAKRTSQARMPVNLAQAMARIVAPRGSHSSARR